MWKTCNRPRIGEIFIHMKRVKIAYKNAIKAHRIMMGDDSHFSNELHELLSEKDMVSFWKTWNA